MLRRAIRFARDLGIDSGLSAEVAQVVIADYSAHYTELATQKDFIITEIENEEKQFLTTLEKGIKEFEKLIS
jgi:alanyl-tRNA synthetase